jgi:hypothetical protein
MLTKNKIIKHLRSIIEEDARQQPDFINLKNMEHRSSFLAFKKMNMMLTMLCQDRILPQVDIDDIYLTCVQTELNTIEECTPYFREELMSIFYQRIYIYLQYLVGEEEYRAAENFRKLKEYYAI